MSDRFLTIQCAHALGYHIETLPKAGPPPQHPCAIRVSQGKRAAFWFNPLHNKEQAFNMLLNFGLSICPETDNWSVWDNEDSSIVPGDDQDLQCAIVKCVAGIKRGGT